MQFRDRIIFVLLCAKNKFVAKMRLKKYIFRALKSFCIEHHIYFFITKFSTYLEKWNIFINNYFDIFFETFTIFSIFLFCLEHVSLGAKTALPKQAA